MFEKDGHEVWCSADLYEIPNFPSEDASADPNSPPLPTIQEGDVFFSQNEETCNSLFDKKSLSITREPEAYGKPC